MGQDILGSLAVHGQPGRRAGSLLLHVPMAVLYLGPRPAALARAGGAAA